MAGTSNLHLRSTHLRDENKINDANHNAPGLRSESRILSDFGNDAAEEAGEERPLEGRGSDSNTGDEFYDISRFSHLDLSVGSAAGSVDQNHLTHQQFRFANSDLLSDARTENYLGETKAAANGADSRGSMDDFLGGGAGNPARGEPLQEVTPVSGTDGDDALLATTATVPYNWSGHVYAFGGDDMIIRDRAGRDVSDVYIYGDTGDDTVSYASANAAIFATLAGNIVLQEGSGRLDLLTDIEGVYGTVYGDSLFGSDWTDRFYGYDGNDIIDGAGGSDKLWGHAGNDTIGGGSGNDLIQGGDDNDELDGNSGSDTIYGGQGNDDINGGSDDDTLHGNAGNDTIIGGQGNDVIHDGDGDDVATGYGGDDDFYIGNGNDTVSGGSGNDRFYIDGNGDNTIHGGNQYDTIILGNASVVVDLAFGEIDRGAAGTDQVSGIENVITGSGHDVVVGNNFDNFFSLGGGHDEASGLGGDDQINGHGGNDGLFGHDGVDSLDGGSGNDTLDGGDDSDQISGGDGEDWIRGGEGADNMIGGADADTFAWGFGDAGVGQVDQIFDFSLDEDMFSFGPGFFNAGPGPVILSSVLVAAWIDGGSRLYANTSTNDGWQAIADLEGVSTAGLNQKIGNRTILNTDVDFAGPDGFDFEPQVIEPMVITVEPVWDVMF